MIIIIQPYIKSTSVDFEDSLRNASITDWKRTGKRKESDNQSDQDSLHKKERSTEHNVGWTQLVYPSQPDNGYNSNRPWKKKRQLSSSFIIIIIITATKRRGGVGVRITYYVRILDRRDRLSSINIQMNGRWEKKVACINKIFIIAKA